MRINIIKTHIYFTVKKYINSYIEKTYFIFIINFAQENSTKRDSTDENGEVEEERMKKGNSNPDYDEAIFEVCESKPDVTDNLYQNC